MAKKLLALISQRLLEEEQAQFEKEQRITREKAAEQEAKDVALIEQMEDVQARMDADELLAERLQQEGNRMYLTPPSNFFSFHFLLMG
ncbi:hypothetical protein Tco_0100431 [Tanacetum coccineum]